jgi:hypothetical protein
MKALRQIGLLVLVLIGGCTPVSTVEPALSARRPKAGDIVEFTADPVSARTNDFEVKRQDIEKVLRSWHQVSQEHWQHGYSHVAFRDRTGTIRLKDGTLIRWLVKPGGLAMLAFQDGTVLHLAKELTPWTEKTEIAYTFLLNKVQEDNLHLIASKDDKNLGLIQKIIKTNKLNLEVENYSNIKEGPDLCYYSKSTKEMAAIIDVTKRNEQRYYVSYYTGPEGGASKKIQIEIRNGKWVVVNDDGMWNVK